MSDVVLVAGGAGYIGSHVCKALAANGFLPVTYDSLEKGHDWAIKWGPFERGDIRDRGRLDEVLERWRPVAVLHFAAFIEVGESVRDPGRYWDNNVVGSLTLIAALRDAGVPAIVFSSTAAVYGMPERVPVDEKAALAPVNPYGATKMTVETILDDFEAAHGLRSVALRYFNAAGADPDGEIGECHSPESHLIPLILDAAIGRRSHISLYGEDYPTPDGTCVRDYIHVTDLASAHVLALKRLLGGGASLRCNLGNGAGFSVKQVLDVARRVTGKAIPAEICPRRPGDPAILVADSSLAIRELGWAPRLAALETQVTHAWAWHQHRPDLK
ncbi:UDP-glucose 4-epimerase GalE [Telmatospirillum siberiense]|uniref:UDP-glucose 4-epimerase n=1 Tax=Telmatospirillum siberiense TaxID=382514 RepID=A0A2N3PVQ6_9PROT|nr:UDP-glucose 4-epimerase GalE [Telmatospirillum siberiense]PKU24470.1 UDP-glucose 4-epimerase GalE [Telmatospirillum siberiense]